MTDIMVSPILEGSNQPVFEYVGTKVKITQDCSKTNKKSFIFLFPNGIVVASIRHFLLASGVL